jgi:hypothetical protein
VLGRQEDTTCRLAGEEKDTKTKGRTKRAGSSSLHHLCNTSCNSTTESMGSKVLGDRYVVAGDRVKISGDGWGQVRVDIRNAFDSLTRENVLIQVWDRRGLERCCARQQQLRTCLHSMCLLGQHPNILSLRDMFASPQRLYLVMDDAVDAVSLSDVLRKYGAVTEERARAFFCEILEAVSHCHDLGVAHNSITLENILIVHQGAVKLTGFSEACDLSSTGLMGDLMACGRILLSLLIGDSRPAESAEVSAEALDLAALLQCPSTSFQIDPIAAIWRHPWMMAADTTTSTSSSTREQGSQGPERTILPPQQHSAVMVAI